MWHTNRKTAELGSRGAEQQRCKAARSLCASILKCKVDSTARGHKKSENHKKKLTGNAACSSGDTAAANRGPHR